MAGRLKEIISKNEPNPIFTFHHSGYPSHTGPGFQYDNEEDLNLYKKSFYENSEYLLPILEIIDNFETINIRNRSKIVFIFGDHGSFVSRNVKNVDLKFKINDEHGILFMIVKNNTGCSLKDLKYYNSDYSTTERVLSSLFRCLSKNPEKLDAISNFYESYNVQNGNSFSKFKYE